MEDVNVLEAHNDVHLFCLHYIFLPRINDALEAFMNAWNHHPVSSEGNLTPIQLWISALAMQGDLNDLFDVSLA